MKKREKGIFPFLFRLMKMNCKSLLRGKKANYVNYSKDKDPACQIRKQMLFGGVTKGNWGRRSEIRKSGPIVLGRRHGRGNPHQFIRGGNTFHNTDMRMVFIPQTASPLGPWILAVPTLGAKYC